MRLQRDEVLANHDDFQDQGEDDHHPRGEQYRILINSQVIGAGATYEHRQSISSGHKTLRAVLRGHENTDVQGHTGAIIIGTSTQQESIGISIKPYGSGGYPTSYMGCYSRLHGNSHLTHGIFANNIGLQDAYIDAGTDEAVFVFHNVGGSSQTMKCYGLVEVK